MPLQSSLIWHSYLVIWILGIFICIWPLPGILAACLILGADRRLWSPARTLICILLFLSAYAYTSLHLYYARIQMQELPPWAEAKVNKNKIFICGNIVHTQGLPDNRLRLVLENVKPPHFDSSAALPGLCSLIWENPETEALQSQQICLFTSIRESRSLANGPEDIREAAYLSQSIYWQLKPVSGRQPPTVSGKPALLAQWRNTLQNNFIKLLPADAEASVQEPHLSQASAMLVALLFGDRRFLEQQSVDNFTAATLAHSLALSGQHLCVAGFLGFLAVLLIGRIYPQIYLHYPRSVLISIASIPPALLYLWIGNAPPSLLRAACMLLILAFWLWRSVAFSAIDLLGMALFLILLYNPLAFMDTGLQLSALCVAVIALTVPALGKVVQIINNVKIIPKFAQTITIRLIQIFLISLFIQLALLPLSLNRFSLAGLWFPLNILWLPVLGFIVLPLAALGAILACFPSHLILTAAKFLLYLATIPCQMLLNLLTWLKDTDILSEPAFLIPHWPVLLAFALLAVILSYLFGRERPKQNIVTSRISLAAVIILLAFGPAIRLLDIFENKVRVSILDVGQAQAVKLQFPPGGTIIIDGGGSFSSRFDTGKNIVTPALVTNHIPKLDAVINSHPDLDHLGGLFYLLEKFYPNAVFHNGEDAAGKNRLRWTSARAKFFSPALYAGDKIILGNHQDNLVLEILHPPFHGMDKSKKDQPYYKGNNASLVLRLSQNGVGLALFTGDVEKEGLYEFLSGSADLAARVVIAPHHGSDNSFLPVLYQETGAQAVVASCGWQNKWGFPGPKLKKYLARNDIPLISTAEAGKIDIAFDSNGTQAISTARPLSQ